MKINMEKREKKERKKVEIMKKARERTVNENENIEGKIINVMTHGNYFCHTQCQMPLWVERLQFSSPAGYNTYVYICMYTHTHIYYIYIYINTHI